MTPNPATSTFEGGQVVANGSPSQQNVYLLDGMYNNDDRLGGSQGTQVRVVLDNIEEYQVLANQYSSEYGGGAGAIINMVTRGGTNQFHGRAYSYFRDETLNARGMFLPDGQPKPPERTLQAGFGLGGPIVQNRAHFYFTYERDNEDIAGQKNFPDRGGAAGGEPGRRVHRARQQLLRARRPAAERQQLHQRALAARGRRRRAARASTPTPRPPTPRSGRPTTTRCGRAPTPACSPTGCRASPASAASASR